MARLVRSPIFVVVVSVFLATQTFGHDDFGGLKIPHGSVSYDFNGEMGGNSASDLKRGIQACAADTVCVTRTNFQYIIDNTFAVPVRVMLRWTAYTGVTFSGPAVIEYDSSNGNRPYTWVIVPANTIGYIATTTSGDAGTYNWISSYAQYANCGTTPSLPIGTPAYDFCWNIKFELSTYKYRIEISTTQYTPIRYRFGFGSSNNCILQDAAGATVTSPYTLSVDGRPPPTGSTVPGRIVGYVASAGTGVNSWYAFSFYHYYKYGDPNAVTTPSTALYSFPFIGSFTVLQGNGGTVSHMDSASEYALDFSMPQGTAVYAARAGYVSFVEESNSQSAYTACPSNPTTCTAAGAGNNYITIIHTDKTIGGYFHIRQNGASVVPGQSVTRGQLIGYSGQTGQAPSPQLHFVVYRITEVQTTGGLQSIQVFYNNGTAKPFIPTQGSLVEWYNGAPRAAPVAPPRAPPVAAPRAPPVAAPTSSPLAPPNDAPVDPPIDSPVAAPEDAPIAEPVDEPLAEPVSEPAAVPEDAPVESPFAENNPVESPRSAPVQAPRASPVSSGPSDLPTANPVSPPSNVNSQPTPTASEIPSAVSLTSEASIGRSILSLYALVALLGALTLLAF